MYKKIKNGSFMNWIWFIIAIVPLLFIFCDYINNSSKYVEGERVDNYIIYQDMTRTEPNSTTSQWENDYLTIGNDEVTLVLAAYNYNSWYIDNSYTEGFLSVCYLHSTTEPLPNTNDIFVYFRIRSVSQSSCSYYYSFDYIDKREDYDSNIYNTNEWVIAKLDYNGFVNAEFDFYVMMMNTNNLHTRFYFDIFVCQTEVNLESTDNLFYKYTNGYYDLLQTIQTNGFISNAFLNLAQFFGVNNVYYSLACYYIEYLLVIVLLHLAFDVLYILPNICHKFMEKIGGERD